MVLAIHICYVDQKLAKARVNSFQEEGAVLVPDFVGYGRALTKNDVDKGTLWSITGNFSRNLGRVVLGIHTIVGSPMRVAGTVYSARNSTRTVKSSLAREDS